MGRRTLFLLFSFLLFALFYYLYEIKFVGKREREREEEMRPFGIIADQGIEAFRFKGEGKEWEVRREGGRWMLTRPVKANCDQGVLNRLLEDIRKVTFSREVGEATEDAQKALGLLEPRAKLSVKAGGKWRTVLIGSENPTGGSLYAMKEGGKKIWLLPVFLWYKVNRPADDLRDRTLLVFDRDRVRAVRVRRGKLEIWVEREGEKWWMRRPLETEADGDEVERLLIALEYQRVWEFVDDAPQDLSSYGLDPPKVEIQITEAGEKTLKLGDLSPGERGVYALHTAQGVVLLSKELLKFVPSRAYDWRKKDIFSFDNDKVMKFSLRWRGKGVICERKEAEGWLITAPERVKGDPEKINSLLWDLKGIKVKTFLPYAEKGLAEKGLSPPLGMVEVWLKGGASPLRLRIGKKEGGRIYAYKEGEEEIYLVAEASEEVFGRSLKDLRSRKVLSFDPSRVREIRIRSPQRTVVVRRSKGIWETGEGRVVDDLLVDTLLWRLRDLEFEEESAEAFSPLYRIGLRVGTEEEVLSVGEEVPGRKGLRYARIGPSGKGYLITEDLPKFLEEEFLKGLP